MTAGAMVKSVYTIISVLSRKRVKDLDRHSAFELLGLKERDGALTAEQIGAVKGLGCLRDKRYEDIVNVRVITRNGKITTDEARAIAEAADLFGSGEVAMTSRMTQEIQGVSYDNIPSLILFLRELRADGRGIITVMHDLPLALEYSDRIAVMSEGRLIATDTPSALCESNIIGNALGVEVKHDGKRYYYERK